MCRTLTVCCQRTVNKNISISDHHLTFSDLKIPCIKPGTATCHSGEAELKDFQNPPTTCAGSAANHAIQSEICETMCHASLREYGKSLHRMNTAGPEKKGWWATWFGKRVGGGKKESSDQGVFVVTRDPEDQPFRLEESRVKLDG
ncbi:hypothetical protein DOTSEDRAFT_18919 [Dothistroma septosporum NZE10]|uniref:Uncharacterized protein n=1 Tax=Dothistroma septosporum (strain NZE10 / CBS 128990) TaxID=675120 RepID=N1PY68_DOTSN|nr:hypothetical protein DOTSEDRAFT_18919 [Dothistroma septosporum NZE10]